MARGRGSSGLLVAPLGWVAFVSVLGSGCGEDDAGATQVADAARIEADADRPPAEDTAPPEFDVSVGRPDATPPPPDAAPPPPDALSPEALASAPPRFRFPIHDEDRTHMSERPVFGVDHDPEDHPGERWRCMDASGQGFPFCYDGHSGSDFMLAGGFARMDAGSARVVAAAGGVVAEAEDGHYDRCHAQVESVDVTCDGNPIEANFVRLRHANGWTTLYYHLKKDSVAVGVGDRVACGEALGLVGSSGISSAPHIHFQVEDPEGVVFDPFAGPESQPETFWTLQADADGLPGGECDPVLGPAP